MRSVLAGHLVTLAVPYMFSEVCNQLGAFGRTHRFLPDNADQGLESTGAMATLSSGWAEFLDRRGSFTSRYERC